MKKLPIGPIVIGMVPLGLIGGLLLATKGPPPQAQDIAVVTVAGDTASPVPLPATAAPAVAPSPSPSPLAPGQDPPAPREPGAINYAEKGVLPAL
jgi:hypothetical protein